MSAAGRPARSRGTVRAARWPSLARALLLRRTARVPRFAGWVPLLAATAAAGMLYGALSGQKRLGVGAFFGFAIGGMVMLFERDTLLPRLRQRLRTLPLVGSVLLTEAAYLVLIVVGHGVAGAICWSLGDVVNTTGRLEALSRMVDSAAVISADLSDRLPALPTAIVARPLGRFALKGRGTMLGVLGLERSGGTASVAAA